MITISSSNFFWPKPLSCKAHFSGLSTADTRVAEASLAAKPCKVAICAAEVAIWYLLVLFATAVMRQILEHSESANFSGIPVLPSY